VNQATIDALSGRDDEAARRIDRLSRSSPLSLNFVPSISLLDNPLFAALRDDPRLAAADERVRTALNLERRKAGLAPISREAWATSARTLLTKN
jgi:hypothetical protein